MGGEDGTKYAASIRKAGLPSSLALQLARRPGIVWLAGLHMARVERAERLRAVRRMLAEWGRAGRGREGWGAESSLGAAREARESSKGSAWRDGERFQILREKRKKKRQWKKGNGGSLYWYMRKAASLRK